MHRIIIAAASLAATVVAQAAVEVEQVGRYRSGAKKGTEIVVVHAASQRAFLSNSDQGWVDVLSLADPTAPKQLARLALSLAKGEDLTSIAVHPSGEYLAAVIETGDPVGRGRVELRATRDGAVLRTLAVGVGPDAGVFSPDGRWLLVADEAEEFAFDPATRTFSSPPGTVTRIDLAQGPAGAVALEIALPDLSATEGVVTAPLRRSLERSVDVNGDGKATSPADLNRDGDIDDEKVLVGTFRGASVFADEANGETFQIPIPGASSDLLEPEHIAFAPDGTRAFVTLQESNAVAVIDVAAGRFERAFGLGIARHATDAVEDDQAKFTDELRALREPDGAAVTADGRYLVTADEGDTEPKFSGVEPGGVGAGGRSLSIFDAATGRLVADTGNQLDEAAARGGFYPDARSGAKGSEPEMAIAVVIGGVQYAIASLERANGIAVVSLADPARPVVVGVACADRSAKQGAVGPEGLAHYAVDGRHWVLTANEKDGTLSVYALRFDR